MRCFLFLQVISSWPTSCCRTWRCPTRVAWLTCVHALECQLTCPSPARSMRNPIHPMRGSRRANSLSFWWLSIAHNCWKVSIILLTTRTQNMIWFLHHYELPYNKCDNSAPGTNITMNALNPGMVRATLHCRHSLLLNHWSGILTLSPWMWLLMKSPTQGAQTSIYLATEPTLSANSGNFYR